MSYAVADGEKSIKHVPLLIKQVIDSGAWQKRLVGKLPVEHKTFRDFIRTAPAKGMGWSTPEDIKQVEALLRYAPDVLVKWREAITGEPGGDRQSEDAKSTNNNIINAPARQGTSLSYTLDRLKRERSDLFNRVVAGELSANAAAIEAGFRKKPVPIRQLMDIACKLSPTERLAALEYLAHLIRIDHLGQPEIALSKINCLVHDMLHGNPTTPTLTKHLRLPKAKATE
jgi:hypothetical protein